MPTVIPGKGCCGDKVAEEEEPVIATPASLESPPFRNLNHLLPTMSAMRYSRRGIKAVRESRMTQQTTPAAGGHMNIAPR